MRFQLYVHFLCSVTSDHKLARPQQHTSLISQCLWVKSLHTAQLGSVFRGSQKCHRESPGLHSQLELGVLFHTHQVANKIQFPAALRHQRLPLHTSGSGLDSMLLPGRLERHCFEPLSEKASQDSPDEVATTQKALPFDSEPTKQGH